MSTDPKQEKVRRRRLRTAERKLKKARQRLAQAERSVLHWSRTVADIKHERTRAIQPPLWPEEEINESK